MDKRNKMFGVEVVLPTCPACGQPTVDPRMYACLKCEWQDPKVWTKDGFVSPPTESKRL